MTLDLGTGAEDIPDTGHWESKDSLTDATATWRMLCYATDAMKERTELMLTKDLADPRPRVVCTSVEACRRRRAMDNHMNVVSDRVPTGGGCPQPLDNRASAHQEPMRGCPPRPQALPPKRFFGV